MEKLNQFWKRYANAYNKFTPVFQKELLKFASEHVNGVVGDLGTGVGKAISYMVDKHDVEKVEGIDLIPEMLFYAQKNIEELNTKKKVKVSQGDITKLDKYFSNESLDSICSLNVLYTLSNPIMFLDKVHRALKSRGILVLASQRRRINLEQISNAMEEEFGDDPDFEQFKQDQVYLTRDMVPKQYENNEIESILKLIGFDILESLSMHYYKSVFTIVARKSL